MRSMVEEADRVRPNQSGRHRNSLDSSIVAMSRSAFEHLKARRAEPLGCPSARRNRVDADSSRRSNGRSQRWCRRIGTGYPNLGANVISTTATTAKARPIPSTAPILSP